MSQGAPKQSPSVREKENGIHGVDLNNLKQELFLKIVVLGDLGVGKTSLVRTYTESGVVGGPGSAGSGSESGGGGGYKVSFDAGYHLKRLEVCSLAEGLSSGRADLSITIIPREKDE